eukprot:scaffold33172_cov29-Attheya_sp.AAC.1
MASQSPGKSEVAAHSTNAKLRDAYSTGVMVKARWPWRPPPALDGTEQAALLLSWVRASRMVFHVCSSVPTAKGGDRMGTRKCVVRESVVVMGSLETAAMAQDGYAMN